MAMALTMSAPSLVLVFAAVMAACLSISWLFGRSNGTIHSFFWGDQRLPWGLTISLILSSSFSLNGLLYQAWLGYLVGWWSLLVQLVWCSSFVLLAFLSRRFAGLLDVGTMHGAIGVRFGEGAKRVAAVSSTIGFAVLIGWEAVVGSTVLQNLSGDNQVLYIALPLALVIISSLYTGSGGLRGNAYINALQNALKIIALIWAAILLFDMAGGASGVSAAPVAGLTAAAAAALLGGAALWANMTFSAFWQVVDMSVWQNLSGTPAEKRRFAVLVSAVAVFIFPGLIGTVIGVSLSSLQPLGVTDTNVLNQVLVALSGDPFVATLLVAAFAASMLSTIDGYSLAGAQAATWDVIFPKKVKGLLSKGPIRTAEPDDRRVIAWGRAIVLILALTGASGVMGLVIYGEVSLFDLVYAVVVAQMSLVGPVVYSLLIPSGRLLRFGALPVIGGLGVGAVMILMRFWGHPDYYTWAPVGAVVVSTLLTGLTLLIPSRRETSPNSSSVSTEPEGRDAS